MFLVKSLVVDECNLLNPAMIQEMFFFLRAKYGGHHVDCHEGFHF